LSDSVSDFNEDTNKSIDESKNENIEQEIKSDINVDILTQDEHILKISKIKEICHRTDISALMKIDQILNVIESKKKIDKDTNESSSRGIKRENEAKTDDVSPSKKPKNREDDSIDGDADEEVDSDVDSCVVCGLGLCAIGNMFNEFNHYMSHGYRVLKEFDVMKRDDSLFLMCNICTSVYPRKCQGNFRKHLQEQHMEKIVEIFRCV